MTVVLLFAPVAGAEVSAEPVPAKARTLSDRGRAFHDAADYASAITAFTLAYAMAPRPALLFNLAQAYRLQGNCDDAALMYRRYLATAPSPQGRALAEAHLAGVERCVHKLPLPAAGNLVASPPSNALSTTRTVTRRSATAEVEKDVGVALTVAGGLALGVAAYFAVRAHDAADDVTAAYDRHAKWKDIAPLDARGKSAAKTAQIFGAGGALGVVGGVAMYMIGRHTRSPVSVTPTVRGVEVGMAWAF